MHLNVEKVFPETQYDSEHGKLPVLTKDIGC